MVRLQSCGRAAAWVLVAKTTHGDKEEVPELPALRIGGRGNDASMEKKSPRGGWYVRFVVGVGGVVR